MDIKYCIDKKRHEKHRYTIENNGNYFVFAKRSRKYGHSMSKKTFDCLYDEAVSKYTEFELWHRRLKKAIKKMNASGLFEDVRSMYENLLTISESDYKDISQKENKVYYKMTKKEFDDMFGMYYQKYPFLFYKDEDGEMRIHCDYFYDIAKCITKSMYFGVNNSFYKNQIKNAINNKNAYSIYREKVGYDVSFEYNPTKKIAFYSEEYVNCGNGHYYYAIDENTALFVEDD